MFFFLFFFSSFCYFSSRSTRVTRNEKRERERERNKNLDPKGSVWSSCKIYVYLYIGSTDYTIFYRRMCYYSIWKITFISGMIFIPDNTRLTFNRFPEYLSTGIPSITESTTAIFSTAVENNYYFYDALTRGEGGKNNIYTCTF